MSEFVKERVYLCECWARDGLQNNEQIIPTGQKLKMLNEIVRAGYARAETTSFSNPKKVPQFADAEEVLRKVDRIPGVSYKSTCINHRAVQRAIALKDEGCAPDEVCFMFSVSEAHNKFNAGMTHEEHWVQLEKMLRDALDNGFRVIPTAGTAFGCPIAGNVPMVNVIEFVRRYVELGATFISIGDTTGAGNPWQAKELFGELRARFPQITFIAHFHDTRGWGVANCLAAYEAGVRYFDLSLGAIGGQPAGTPKYHIGFSGNTSSEDLVCMFEEMGISTGISQDEVIRLGKLSEEILGSPQKSNIVRCGKVVH